MAEENNKYSQYTQGMTESQAAKFARLADIYESRFQYHGQTPGMEGVDADELSLSDYSQEIQNILSNSRFSEIQSAAERRGMERLLETNNIDAGSFFKQNPNATPIDAIREANFNSFRDKEKRYSDPRAFTYESGAKSTLSKLNNQYNALFQNSFLFPEMGKELNELLPDYIKEDPEKRAQFERAFYYETGGAKIDFDESGRVGDIHTDSVVGNMARGAGYALNDLMSEVVDGALGTANAIYDLAGGDIEEADKEFVERQKAGEVETAMQREERLQDDWVWSDPIFWAAFSSPEARRQVYSTNKGVERTIDFQAIMDRGGVTEATAGQLWGAGIDQLVQSAPLLLDLAAGTALSKGVLKGVTKGVTSRAATRAGKKAAARGKGFVDPKTGRFISKDAAKAMNDRVDQINKAAARTNNIINQGGAFLVSDALVASQIHADNVGQEWYDNLSQGERFTYLGIQAGAEVASGMVLSNIFVRGFGPGKMTQNIFNGQKNAMREYSKNVVRSVLLGAGEEVVAEGATAGVQYWNEIRARIQGGDQTAYYDPKELNKRIIEGATAGLLMGGLAGGFSGAVGGAAKASLANYGAKVVEAKKKQQEATKALDKAVTQTAKKDAMRRLEQATKEYTASQTAMARAYNRMAQSDSETFEEIARMQGMINMKVHQHNTSTDPEFQGAIFQEIKALVEKKQELETEAAKAAGVENLDGLYKEEFDKINKERTNKEKEHRVKMESDPEMIAQRELEGQMQAQKDAFDAAEAANSPDQNADDDTQDREGQTQEDSGMVRDEEAPIEGVEGTADKPMNPNALDGQPLADKYRDLTEKMNNLLKAFKPLGINAVVHTTEQSFFNATGSTALGVFRRGKTVHINLEQKGATANTVRHEFLHAAFTTVTPQKKQQFLEDLRGISGINARNIEKAVEEAYQDVSPEVLVEEKIVNILERTLDNPALEARQSVIQRILNAFRRMLGVKEQITESDLQGFVRQFRAAERTGARFEGQQVGQSADMEAREFGVRQPSKAYPDLINKVVNYRVYYLDKLGGQQSYQTNGLRFNDYWHFRNWYLKETGNGKMAANIGQFTYTGDDGTLKKINPPKPKRDRETGEIIDMEPRLRTPQQRKMEKAAESDVRRKRVVRYRDIKVNAGKALKFAVGKIQKIDKTGELAFYNEDMLLEQDSQSELPVAYSETFFTEGLNVDELDQLGRDFGNNLEFLIPITQEADFAFTVRNNGDGTVTIDAHSDAKINVDPQSLSEGDSFSGTVQMEARYLKPLPESKKQTLFDIIGRTIESIKLSELQGMRVVMAFYDPTSGGRSGIGADYPKGYLFSQSEEESAEKTFQRVEEAAIQNHRKIIKEAEKFGKNSEEYKNIIESIKFVDKDNNVTYRGRILLTTGFMSEGSLIGNKDFIGESFDLYRDYYKRLVDTFGEDRAQGIFVKSFNAFLSKGLSASQKTLMSNISSSFDLYKKEGFTSVRISELPGRTRRIAVPQNADAVFELMNSIRDSQTKGITAFRNKKDIVKKMMTDTEGGFSNTLDESVNSVMTIDESLGDPSIKNQTPRINDVKESLKNKGVIIEESELSQKALYHKLFEYELSEEKTLEGRTALSLSNVEVGKSEAEGREELPFPWYLKVKEGSEGGLIGEYVSEEELEVLDMLQNYRFKTKSDKPIGKEETSLVEDVSAKEEKIRDWDKENMNRELSELLNELSSLRSALKDKNLTLKDKLKSEKRIDQILNPRTKTESFKKIQEREALTASLDLSKKELSSFYSSVKKLQDAPFEGELSMYDADNSTRDLESRNLGLNLDNESQMPFEPNRLNGFQAFMARVDQLFANKYANVFSLQRAIEGAKKAVVDISQDFINAETLMYGKTANDLEKLDEKVKVISQEMKDAGLIGEDVSQFLIARHAEERNALIAERTDGETLSGSGMSNERAQEVMDSFSPEKKAALESIAKKVDAITKDTRQTMVKFGLESQETIDAFEAMFDNYVPLGGLSADEMSADTSLYPTGGAGMSIYGDTTRRAKGRASEANNVLAQAIAQNAAVHAKARKNEALSSLYNLVEANPNTKVWRISSEVPFDAQSAVGVRVNGDQKFIVFTNADHAKALKNMGVEKLDLFSKVMRSFSGFLRRSFTTANPEFIISNFARDIQSALFNAMAEADIPGGQIQSKYIATKIIERVKQTLPALLKGAVGKDLDPEMAAYFEEFKEDGGQTGWGFVKDVGTIAAEIEAEVSEKNRAQKARDWMMKNSIEVVENVNDAFENSIRLAAYMEARKAGASREKAAELAKNITVNFNRSGELGAVANAWYMFFNASVQGTVRLARSLGTLKDVRKPNGELESWHNRLNAAQKMAFGLSLTTGMLTAINLAMSDEDEDGVLFYNKIPDYEKERNLIIMYDGKNYLKIPLPYGFNVFANMGSAMAEAAGGHREPEDAGMFLLNSAFSSFSPISFGQSKDAAKYLAKGATPTIFKPLVDIAVNESYFGSSVYKEQFPVGAPKPEAEMSFRSPEGVRKFFQWMNEATGGSEFVPGKADFNPDKFWYGFEYYIGGAGQFVTRTIGTGRDTYEMIKEGEKVPMKANDFPFLRKVYG